MKKIFFSLVALLVVVSFSAPLSYADESAYEIEFWQSVKNSHDPADLEEYIRAYPKGKFTGLARNKIKRLTGKSSQPAQVAPSPAKKPIPEETYPEAVEQPIITPPVATAPVEPVAPPPVEPISPSSPNAKLIFYIQDTCGYCEEWSDTIEEDCNDWATFSRFITIDKKVAITSEQPVLEGIFGRTLAIEESVVQAGAAVISPGTHTISYECGTDGSGKSEVRRARQSVEVGAGETKHLLIEPAKRDRFYDDMKISIRDSAPANVASE